MSRKTNDIKKRPKKGLKIVCSVIGCAFALLSVFAPFAGLKSAKAALGFPPSYDNNYNGLDKVSVYPLYPFLYSFYGGIDINYEDGFDINTGFISQYSCPLFVDGSNVHEEYHDLGTYGDLLVRVSNNQVYFRQSNTVPFLNSSFAVLCLATQLVSPMYVDETLYKYYFCDSDFPLGFYFGLSSGYIGDASYEYYWYLNLGYYDDGVYTTYSLSDVLYSESGVFRTSDNFPSFEEFNDLGLLYDGYLYIEDFSVYAVAKVPYYTAHYISVCCEKRINGPLSIEYFNSVQDEGNKVFRYYNFIPVDDIGLGVITQTVSEFFNTEFIPGFRLWYFLLIGLGCAIVGIALKFFLGG